jgi:hypothetical protein
MGSGSGLLSPIANSGGLCCMIIGMEDQAPTFALFSYGTLQLPQVQIATCDRLLDGSRDTLIGYRLEPLAISDTEVIRVSGKAVHTIARHTGDPDDRIDGLVYMITKAELAATDGYEVDVYGRVAETLASGREAMLYIGPPLAPE